MTPAPRHAIPRDTPASKVAGFLRRQRLVIIAVAALLVTGALWWAQQQTDQPNVQLVLAIAIGVTGGVVVWSAAMLIFGWLSRRAKR